MVFQRSMVDWKKGARVSVPWVHIHSAICESYVVLLSCIDLCMVGGGGWSQSAMGICAFFYM